MSFRACPWGLGSRIVGAAGAATIAGIALAIGAVGGFVRPAGSAQGGSTAAGDDAAVLTLDAPGGAWTLSIALPGFDIGPVRDADGGVWRLAADVDSGLVVTASIERIEGADDARSCRSRHWKRLKAEHDAVVRPRDRERGPAAIREFRVREIRGVPVDQRHVVAYLHRDNACAIVHANKPGYVKDDDARFDAVLDAIRIAPR